MFTDANLTQSSTSQQHNNHTNTIHTCIQTSYWIENEN